LAGDAGIYTKTKDRAEVKWQTSGRLLEIRVAAVDGKKEPKPLVTEANEPAMGKC
jgi:hypothetical protein